MDERPPGQPRVWSAAARTQPHQVEAHLAMLQDQHRLAIHAWENSKPLPAFPEFSWQHIRSMKAEDVASRLGTGDKMALPLMSMSLLPSHASGHSMKPWGMAPGMIWCGYLLDMRQDQEHPPRILKVSPRTIDSGNDPYDKNLRHRQVFKIAELDAFYKTIAGLKEYKKRIASEEGKSLGAFQLDQLGQWYENNPSPPPRYRHEEPVFSNNEVIAAVAKEHIAALVVPYYAFSEARRPMSRLMGALAGLQHLDEGLNVPVVYYGVLPDAQERDAVELGRCHYLAQGGRELHAMALGAIGELQENDMKLLRRFQQFDLYSYEPLKAEVKDRLGIDLEIPLPEQRAAVEKLREAGETGAESRAGGGPRL